MTTLFLIFPSLLWLLFLWLLLLLLLSLFLLLFVVVIIMVVIVIVIGFVNFILSFDNNLRGHGSFVIVCL